MRSRKPRGRHRAMVGAIVLAGACFTAHAAFAQSDGDERCSKKGAVLMYNDSSRSWEAAGGHCTPRGPNGPADGDRKCGSEGFTVKYIAKIDTWRNTNDHCGGSSPQGDGVHIQTQGM